MRNLLHKETITYSKPSIIGNGDAKSSRKGQIYRSQINGRFSDVSSADKNK
jgi:hypothetical protein